MNRHTVLALAVFVILGLAFLATRESQVSVGVHKLTLPRTSADAITSIELGGATPLVLSRSGTGWTVATAAAPQESHPADEAQVNALLDALLHLKAPDFLTEKAEKHAELELDAARGITVTLKPASGPPALALVLGKSAKNGGDYLRLAGNDEVFITRGGLGWQVRRGLSDWRKKGITTLAAAELTRLTLAPPSGEGLVLVRDGERWRPEATLPEGFRFDDAAAQRLVGALTSLVAQDFAGPGEGEEALGLQAPTVFTLESNTRAPLVLKLGEKRGERRALRVEGDPQVYWLAGWQADQLALTREGLRDLRVLEFDVARATRLSVSAGSQRTVVAREAAGWRLVAPGSAPAGLDLDLTQVPPVLSRLSGLRALRVEPRAFPKGGASTTVEVELEGGAVRRLAFAAPAGSQEVLVKGADGLTYVAAAADQAWLARGLELFKRPPPPPQGGLRGLEQLPPELRAQLEAQLRSQAPAQ